MLLEYGPISLGAEVLEVCIEGLGLGEVSINVEFTFAVDGAVSNPVGIPVVVVGNSDKIGRNDGVQLGFTVGAVLGDMVGNMVGTSVGGHAFEPRNLEDGQG